MNYSQTNTRTGPIQVQTNFDPTSLVGTAVKISATIGAPVPGGAATISVAVPNAVTDYCPFIITNAISWNSTTSIGVCEVTPVAALTEARIVVGSTAVTQGDLLVCYGNTVAGQAFTWASGAAFIIGIAEESSGGSGGQVLFRPLPHYRPS